MSQRAFQRGRRGREAEGGGLLNRYRVVKLYRGFESLRLRQRSKSLVALDTTTRCGRDEAWLIRGAERLTAYRTPELAGRGS